MIVHSCYIWFRKILHRGLVFTQPFFSANGEIWTKVSITQRVAIQLGSATHSSLFYFVLHMSDGRLYVVYNSGEDCADVLRVGVLSRSNRIRPASCLEANWLVCQSHWTMALNCDRGPWHTWWKWHSAICQHIWRQKLCCHVFRTASQYTCAMKTLDITVFGVNSKCFGFSVGGAIRHSD